MKYTGICVIALLFFMGFVTQGNTATIKVVSTSFGANYNKATSYNSNFHSSDSIDHAESFGYQAEMKIGVAKKLNLLLGFNYAPIKIWETDKGATTYGFPVTAYSRTGFPYWYGYYSQFVSLVGIKSKINQKNIYDVKANFNLNQIYINLNLGLEYEFLTEGRFRPFISAGITPSHFETRGYLTVDAKAFYQDPVTGATLGTWHYKMRDHMYPKARGFMFDGFVSGGFDLMITNIVGFQAGFRYIQVLKDNKRNRITGFYNLAAGLVFRQPQ